MKRAETQITGHTCDIEIEDAPLSPGKIFTIQIYTRGRVTGSTLSEIC
jgi:hypothetical protein